MSTVVLVNTAILNLVPEILMQQAQGWTKESAFKDTLLVILLQVTYRPHFEKKIYAWKRYHGRP